MTAAANVAHEQPVRENRISACFDDVDFAERFVSTAERSLQQKA